MYIYIGIYMYILCAMRVRIIMHVDIYIYICNMMIYNDKPTLATWFLQNEL